MTSGSGVDIFPHQSLLQVPTIAQYLKIFRFYRAGVKARITVQSLENQFGLLMISALPQTSTGYHSLEARSQANAVFLPIVNGGLVEYKMPYLSNRDMYDLSNPLDSWRLQFDLDRKSVV